MIELLIIAITTIVSVIALRRASIQYHRDILKGEYPVAITTTQGCVVRCSDELRMFTELHEQYHYDNHHVFGRRVFAGVSTGMLLVSIYHTSITEFLWVFV